MMENKIHVWNHQPGKNHRFPAFCISGFPRTATEATTKIWQVRAGEWVDLTINNRGNQQKLRGVINYSCWWQRRYLDVFEFGVHQIYGYVIVFIAKGMEDNCKPWTFGGYNTPFQTNPFEAHVNNQNQNLRNRRLWLSNMGICIWTLMYTNGIAIAEFRCIHLESIFLDGISVVCEKPITCGSNHSEIVFGAWFSGFAGPSREGVGSIEKKNGLV